MKASEMAAEQKAIRATAERVRDVRGRVRGDAAFKERVVRPVAARRKAGASLDAIAAAIGIPKSSLVRWSGSSKGAKRRSRVRVSAEGVAHGGQRFAVHGPGGLRIEGLSVGELAALWAKLS